MFADNDLFRSISKTFILNSQVTSSGELQICGIPNGGFDMFIPQQIIGWRSSNPLPCYNLI